MRRIFEPPDLDAETRAIIETARGAYEPNELDRARVRKGVAARLAAGIVLAVGPASAVAGVAKLTAAVVVVGTVVGTGIYVLPARHDEPRPRREPAARTLVRPAPAPPPAAAPPPVTLPAPARAPSRRRAAAAPPAPVESASRLKEETALLGAASSALGRGDVPRALALLDEYDRRPGSAILAEERTVTGILVSCAAGRVHVARAEARHFQARWPRSPLGARVDGSCAGTARSAPVAP